MQNCLDLFSSTTFSGLACQLSLLTIFPHFSAQERPAEGSPCCEGCEGNAQGRHEGRGQSQGEGHASLPRTTGCAGWHCLAVFFCEIPCRRGRLGTFSCSAAEALCLHIVRDVQFLKITKERGVCATFFVVPATRIADVLRDRFRTGRTCTSGPEDPLGCAL